MCYFFVAGFSQFNNSNSNQIAFVRPNTEKQSLKSVQNNHHHQPHSTADSSGPFSFPNNDALPKKSPKATPRQIPDPQLMSNGLYENIDRILPPMNRCLVEDGGPTPVGRCSGYSSSGSRGSSEHDLIHHQLEIIRSVDMIPEELSSLSVAGLCDCLHLFELPNAACKFKQNQIDGQFFMIMTDQMFKDEGFSFTEFEVVKLKRLRGGWRPRL